MIVVGDDVDGDWCCLQKPLIDHLHSDGADVDAVASNDAEIDMQDEKIVNDVAAVQMV